MTAEEPLCWYQSFDPISEGLKVDIGLPSQLQQRRDSFSHKLLTIITRLTGERCNRETNRGERCNREVLTDASQIQDTRTI